jgi:hypothetical protein
MLLAARAVMADTPCDKDCDAAAVMQYEACIAALGPDATDADEDLCRDEAKALRDQCRDACPDDNPDDGDECRDQCELDANIIFEECVAGLGENPTNDEIDVCEDEARAVRDACSVHCPVNCEEQCGIDAKTLYSDCIASFGGNPTDAERDQCKADARAFRSACRAECPLPCHEQCGKEADALYDECIASFGGDPTPEEEDMCDDEARAYRDACRADCTPMPNDPDECRDQCEADATIAFEECVAGLGENPTNDEIDVCEDDARGIRDACNATCGGGAAVGSGRPAGSVLRKLRGWR